ncbi:hypothetical protein BCR35DRAFT_306506 [Leucosporidium creatinivorum]|uniref:Uncharacterized protein n=1 Tax=Leucosporidium creatinivorum TaxID=106004 RepID=A0A1Y2EV95_9BASI|nr:hypothetical protein BCR35DRAFT_306506 [Leucosporidium creatinivorum]
MYSGKRLQHSTSLAWLDLALFLLHGSRLRKGLLQHGILLVDERIAMLESEVVVLHQVVYSSPSGDGEESSDKGDQGGDLDTNLVLCEEGGGFWRRLRRGVLATTGDEGAGRGSRDDGTESRAVHVEYVEAN